MEEISYGMDGQATTLFYAKKLEWQSSSRPAELLQTGLQTAMLLGQYTGSVVILNNKFKQYKVSYSADKFCGFHHR